MVLAINQINLHDKSKQSGLGFIRYEDKKQCYYVSLNETKFNSTTTFLVVDPIHKLKIAPD